MSDVDPYAAKALDGELERVRAAQEGTRNDTLHMAAFRVGQLLTTRALPVDQAERDLVDAGVSAGLPRREAAATVRSGLRGGYQHPRDPAAPTNGAPLAGLLAAPAGGAAGGGPAGLSYEDRWRVVDAELGLAPVSPSLTAVSPGLTAVRGEDHAGHRTPTDSPTGDAAPTWDERIAAAAVDAQALDNIPTPEPLIPNALFRDTMVWLFGAPASCKSFIALDMAGCVGTGENWQGFGKPVAGPVLYVVAEGASGLRARVRAWEKAMGQPMTNVHFLPLPVQVTDTAAWEALVRYAVGLGAVLVVLDTQARVSVGLEENSAKEMGMFVARMERLRAATRACVMAIHHTGRGGEHMRGSIALDGAADTLIKVCRSHDLVEVECTKQKDAPEFSQLRLRMVPYEGSVIMSVTELIFPSTMDSPVVLRMLSGWWDSFETDWVTVKTLCDTTGCARATFFRNVKRLEKQGLVETAGNGAAKRWRLLRAPGVSQSQTSITESHEAQASASVLSLTVSPPFRGETGETETRASGLQASPGATTWP